MVASGNSIDIVAMIGGILLVTACPYLVTYLYYRRFVWEFAREEQYGSQPTRLFVYSMAMGYAWLLLTPVFLIIAYALTCGLVSCLILPAGAGVGIIVAIRHFKRTLQQRARVLENPPPQFQIWLQDIMVAAFTLGLTLTVITNLSFLIPERRVFVALVVCEIATQIVMFLVILDAARYSPRLSESKARMGYVFGMLLVNTLFPIPLLPAVAWNAWRRAMALADEPKVPLL